MRCLDQLAGPRKLLIMHDKPIKRREKCLSPRHLLRAKRHTKPGHGIRFDAPRHNAVEGNSILGAEDGADGSNPLVSSGFGGTVFGKSSTGVDADEGTGNDDFSSLRRRGGFSAGVVVTHKMSSERGGVYDGLEIRIRASRVGLWGHLVEWGIA